MRFTGALILLALAVACLLAVADAFPQGYAKGKAGQTKIQTYRGPNEEKGGYHSYDAFAPWGFYVQQPEDDKPKGYHH